MTGSYWKTGSPAPRRERIVWPSPTQALRQLGIALIVGVLWDAVFFGYLRLTRAQTESPTAARPEPITLATTPAPESTAPLSPTAAGVSPVPSPTPSTPTHTATAWVVNTPPAATPTATPEPTAGETASPEPSPTATDTPVPSLTATDTPTVPPDTPVPIKEPGEVSFAADVLPIFERRCVKCHGGEKTEEGLVLKTYADTRPYATALSKQYWA